MPEVAEPEIQIDGATELQDKGFGNIEAAFDGAFPSTAKKPVDEPIVNQEPAKVETPPVVEEPAKVDEPRLVPEKLFGPKVEPVVEEQKIETPKHIKDPKQIQNFEQMRTLYEGTKQELSRQSTDFARQLAEAKAQAVDQGAQERIKALEQQNQDLLSKVERQSVQDHPKFQQEITLPIRRAFGEAHQLLKDSEVDPKLLDRAFSLQGPAHLEALDEIYSKLPESAKAELAASVRDIRSLYRKRGEILANAHGAAEELKKHDSISRHQQLEQHAQHMEKLSSVVVAKLQDTGFEAYIKSDDPNDSWWNETVDKRLADAKHLLTKEEDSEQHAIAAHMAVALPFYRDFAKSCFQRAKTAETKLAAIQKAEPGLAGEGIVNASEDDANLTFAQSVAKNSGLR